ncbi:sulfur-oxidizing protein SoxY [Oceanospirillum multiglobuliferum]|uniref:Quinoprotein dehydrogenase-associated SoxYZ-like carrier n=1 Tax=Oceanospirillum multiglobuliferum TaxID=64969 RepID=A0A1T4PHF0_9GAMM|nr:quinoprotein dehydrogenase-associated SoxYZ-like carrier [Oceanospirillum multiglobuliferum]OPX55547.1 quinoprotein dehydrogenase-associated SoxYZ-like carrier [Oceanospirillum multiglobuliferum]SJZ90841.1 sulfur-oxidizing protein SoxY [Oceanospirillum multiglobuliferum]
MLKQKLRDSCLLLTLSGVLGSGVAYSDNHSLNAESHAPTTQNANPLMDVMWDFMREQFIGSQPWQYSDQVKITLPSFAEDSTQVPVMVSANIPQAQQLILFADLNPIQKIAQYQVQQGELPDVALQFRVQQATPVHALVQDQTGLWHVGRAYVDAAGGGCSAPKVAANNEDWSSNLGQVNGRLFQNANQQRLKVQIFHPMDTGLIDGTPAFWLNEIEVQNEQGTALGLLRLSEPVSANPRLTLNFKQVQNQGLQLSMRDNDGNHFQSPLYQSAVNSNALETTTQHSKGER